MNYKVKILLATFNGEKYISTQLESIIRQSYSNWEILISDDGSNDNTLSIIKEYCLKDERIRIVNEDLIKQGACQNFGNLLEFIRKEDWDFLMFADQDDFWFDNKIQLTINSMLDGDNFDEKPKLVYTDFIFAIDKLVPLQKETEKNISNWAEPNLAGMLVQNNIYGCTIMINKALANKACPVPICSENHDYWIGLVAVSLGSIVHLKEPTMLYRQHSNNLSGHYTNNSSINRSKRFFRSWEKLEKSMLSSHKQAFELVQRYASEMPRKNNALISEYCQLVKNRSFKLFFYCYKNKIKRNTFAENVMLFLLILKILIRPNKKLL